MNETETKPRTTYRWWVVHPVDQDALHVFLVRYRPDREETYSAEFAECSEDDISWSSYQVGGFIRPFLMISGHDHIDTFSATRIAADFAAKIQEAMKEVAS